MRLYITYEVIYNLCEIGVLVGRSGCPNPAKYLVSSLNTSVGTLYTSF